MNHSIPSQTIQKLLTAAKSAQQNAHAPYSHFRVGAALLTTDGQVITGANVENASFGATICAERTAMCTAVSLGHREFAAIGLVTDAANAAWPCGICRQVLAEFSPKLPVFSTDSAGKIEVSSIEELLPKQFTVDDLEKVPAES